MHTNIWYGQEDYTTPALSHFFRRAQQDYSVPTGAIILRRGESGNVIYLIPADEVAIVSDGVCIAIYGAGRVVGEVAPWLGHLVDADKPIPVALLGDEEMSAPPPID